MKCLKYVVLLCNLFVSIGLMHASSPANREENAFEKAKALARVENKKILVNFYADWCTPCKYLHEVTLQDEGVQHLIHDNFIPVRINIDDFDGFELKSKFDVRFLPTILIFNESGVMIDRKEETLNIKKMTDLLTFHVQSVASPYVHTVNSRPSDIFKKTPPVSHSGKSLYRMQIGVYSSLDRAILKSEELQGLFADKVTILREEKSKENYIYRVLLGEFRSEEEATSFKSILNTDFGISSVVY
jgi:thiol-disulfide isomerase/thioredoxin